MDILTIIGLIWFGGIVAFIMYAIGYIIFEAGRGSKK